MKKIYIVSELFYPNRTSTAYIMTELANYLASFFELLVITTDSKYDENISCIHEKFRFKIIRQKSIKIDKNSVLKRIQGSIISSFLLSYSLFKKVKKEEKVLIVTNPFLNIFFVAVARVFKKFELIILVHDVFPENTIPAGLNDDNTLRYLFLKKIFDWSYRRADKLIVLGEDMKNVMINKGVLETSINVITNWYDDNLKFQEVDRSEYFGIPDLNNKIVIGFAGNIGRVQNLGMFIEYFNESANPNLALVIIGDGAMLKTLKGNNSNKNIYFIGSKPRSEQAKFLNSFDISLITLNRGMYGLGVPSKSYNILKSGNPLLYIGDTGSEIDLLIKRYDCGWSFNWEQKKDVINFFDNIQKFDLSGFKLKNEKIADKIYSSSKIKKKFLNVLNN